MNTDKRDELDSLLAELKQARQPSNASLQHEALAERIMSQLPEQAPVSALSRRRQWLLPTGAALAASLVALAVLIPATNTGSLPVDASFEQWAWEEVLDETPVNDNDHAAISMVAMLEFDAEVEAF